MHINFLFVNIVVFDIQLDMLNLFSKNLPNPKTYPIVPPDMDYIYFENAELVPFESNDTNINIKNLWWLSECSFLVYNHPGFARMAFKLAGFNSFKFFSGIGTECMVAMGNNAVIVTFRGTELKSLSGLYELWTDINTVPVSFEQGGKVHKGFLNALYEIWNGDNGLYKYLQNILEENKNIPVWITGHSLGGALASLCFSLLENATGLVMFGAPKVGDSEYVKLTKNRAIFRVENRKDPIVNLPPNIPNFKFNYKDAGTLIYIDNSNSVLSSRPELSNKVHLEIVKNIAYKQIKTINTTQKINFHIKNSLDEWSNYKEKLLNDRAININDHMPINYSISLWNILLETIY